MSEVQKKPLTVEDIVRRIEASVECAAMSTVETAVENSVESAMRHYRDELIAAVKRDANRVEASTADEVARTLRSLVAAAFAPAVRGALDAVLRALEGEPVDLLMLPQRIARAA